MILVQGTNGIDAFSKGIHFRKINIKSSIHFGKIGMWNRYVSEASMARPRSNSGQVQPPGGKLPRNRTFIIIILFKVGNLHS